MTATRLIKLDEVKRLTGLGKTAIYKQIADGAFPRPAKVGASSLWSEAEIDEWIAATLEARGAA